MISCDTNVLFPACDLESTSYQAARAFLAKQAMNESFCLCEQVLMELYCLLRNPGICRHPMPAAEAVRTIRGWRSNPHWRIVDVVMSGDIMEGVWGRAAEPAFAYRRIFDARLAFTLRHHGVTEFATRNVKDFSGFGFERVWNPFGGATGDRHE